MATKKIKFLADEVRDGHYVRAWKERREINVQVWNRITAYGEPEGAPDGDWAMPGALGLEVCIDQAILQTMK